MITNVNFIPVTKRDGMLGFMNCLFDGKLYLSSIAVKMKEDGTIYLLCPAKKYEDKNLQYFYPINAETYQSLLDAVVPMVQKFLNSEEK